MSSTLASERVLDPGDEGPWTFGPGAKRSVRHDGRFVRRIPDQELH